MATHTVTAPLVIVKDENGADQYLYKGATLPSHIKGDDLKRLKSEKLVEETKAEEQPASEAVGSDDSGEQDTSSKSSRSRS